MLSTEVTSPTGLVDAVNAANSSGSPTTITLAPGTTFDFTTTNNYTNGGNALPVITSNITIVGNGDTIERTGLGAFRFFDVPAGVSLTLQNLTLQDGLVVGSSACGGAVFNSGTLNLDGVTLQFNEAIGSYGVRSSYSRPPTAGGNAAGGGIYVGGGTLILTNDLIKGNEALGGNGGNCHLDCVAGTGGDASGGGVFVSGNERVTLMGDTFASNSAKGGSGGNANSRYFPSLPSQAGAGGRGGFGGSGIGGGLYVDISSGQNLTISSDYFNNNNAQGGMGGAGGDPAPSFRGNLSQVGSGGSGGNALGGGLIVTVNSFTLNLDIISYNAAVGGRGGSSGVTSDGLACLAGYGGSAIGGGACFDGSAEQDGMTTLINCFISQDTVTGGAVGAGDPDYITAGTASFPLISGYVMSLTAGSPLPLGTVAAPYATQTISALPVNSDTPATLNYNLTSSSLGLNFSASGNQLTISGTPTAAGTVTFTVTATDSGGSTQPKEYTLTINPRTGGGGTGGGNGTGTNDTGGGSGAGIIGTGGGSGGSVTLNVPPLLALFDSLIGGVETVNANGTETMTDSFFGFPLLVSTFDSSGDLVSVDLFGFDVTFLFG